MKIVIWKRKDNTFYYKMVKGFYGDYHVGYVNQYGHQVVHTIDNVYVINPKMSFKKRCINRFIRFLQKV